MTTTATRPARNRRPQWLRATILQLRVYLYLYAITWLLFLVGIAVAIVLVNHFGTVDLSVAQFVRTGPLVWFVFALAIMVPSSYLTPHVANGLTRRSFTVASLLAVLVHAHAQAVTATTVMFLEGALYAAMGWQHDVEGGATPVPGLWEQGAGILLLDYALASLSGAVSGLLLGIAYYRLGGWRGTLLLPLVMVPILAVMFLSTWGNGSQAWLNGNLAGAATAVALILAGAVAFALLARNVQITRLET